MKGEAPWKGGVGWARPPTHDVTFLFHSSEWSKSEEIVMC